MQNVFQKGELEGPGLGCHTRLTSFADNCSRIDNRRPPDAAMKCAIVISRSAARVGCVQCLSYKSSLDSSGLLRSLFCLFCRHHHGKGESYIIGLIVQLLGDILATVPILPVFCGASCIS